MPLLNCQKHLFDLEDHVSYLNCAYMSPLLTQVKNKGLEMVALKSNPYQIGMDDFFGPIKTVKKLFAQLINFDDYRRIALIPSASYGIANAVRNTPISEGQNIVMPAEQFPSNYYSWKQKCDKNAATINLVPCPDASSRTSAWNEAILEAINPQTAAVAISHTHWADGTVFNLMAIREKCTAMGALLIIDGTQSLGSLPFDQSKIKADALIVAGYKTLLGPYSIGVAYYGEKFDHGSPIEDNWLNYEQSDDFANLVHYKNNFQEKAARYNVGESSNFILTNMLKESLQQILKWTPAAIQSYCHSIIQKPTESIRSLGFGIEEPQDRAGHLFGIRTPKGFDLDRFHQTCQKKKLFVSIRGTSIRVSPHVYNTADDLWLLTEVLREQ